MDYQLLVATTNRKNDGLYSDMNIHSDAIIVNQSDFFDCQTVNKGEYSLLFYSFNERGVGLNRNTALLRATADIIQFADDDMIFTDTHREDVLREFEKHPEADAILFSVESLNKDRPLKKIHKFGRVRKFQALKYGCARLAVRREALIYNNITFSLLFGGGAKYSSGEDTVLLQDCIRAGMKIYRSTVKVADIKQDESSWFKGYNEKYFFDKGVLFAAALPKLCYLYAVISAVKNKKGSYGKSKIFRLYMQGIREFKNKKRGKK